jgi:hypothetical protein
MPGNGWDFSHDYFVGCSQQIWIRILTSSLPHVPVSDFFHFLYPGAFDQAGLAAIQTEASLSEILPPSHN